MMKIACHFGKISKVKRVKNQMRHLSKISRQKKGKRLNLNPLPDFFIKTNLDAERFSATTRGLRIWVGNFETRVHQAVCVV